MIKRNLWSYTIY